MSTDTPTPRSSSPAFWPPRLSISAVTKSLSRKSSRSLQPDTQLAPGDPSGLLSPQDLVRPRTSSTSLSVSSAASSSAGDWIKKLSRSRSASVSSAVSDKNQPVTRQDFIGVESWFDTFQKYNRLITEQVSVDAEYPTEQLSKIQETISDIEGGYFISDLPEAMFDIALLWCPAGDTTRKTGVNEPSWSWRGWNGPVNFPFDPSSCPDVRKRNQPDIFFESKIPFFAQGPPKSEAYTIRNRQLILKPDTVMGRRPRIRYPTEGMPRLSGSEPSKRESVTLRFAAQKISAKAFRTEQIYIQKVDKKASDNADDAVDQTHDEADYTIGYSDNGKGAHPILCSDLIDSSDRYCGVIMDYKRNIDTHDLGKLYFILLSVNRRVPSNFIFDKNTSNTSHTSGIPIWKDGKFLSDIEIADPEMGSSKRGRDSEWKMYNVMLIQETPGEFGPKGEVIVEPIAQRVAIGRIHEDAWKAACPKKANIALR